MHVSHMTRRTFLKASELITGAVTLGSLAACGNSSSTDAPSSTDASGDSERQVLVDKQAYVVGTIAAANHTNHAGDGSTVLFTHNVNAEALKAIYAALGTALQGPKIGVKLSTGEPGSNHLSTDLIADLVHELNGTIVECNTAYEGPRDNTESHYQVAADHCYSKIADFQILDEDGSVGLPVTDGLHLSENLVGAHFPDYSSYLILSHFKGHQMAGFGGALKNVSIGMASAAGKFRIHSGGRSDTDWNDADTPVFQECMADACKSIIDQIGDRMLYINVMNNISVDCDCSPAPATPKMADVGILASTDPVALDQACIDLVYDSDDDTIDLISRIETLNGEHILEAAESLKLGSRAYTLVEIG